MACVYYAYILTRILWSKLCPCLYVCWPGKNSCISAVSHLKLITAPKFKKTEYMHKRYLSKCFDERIIILIT